MDCVDIVVGAARGKQSRILDYYTRDRSTPRTDDFYGGRDSLTAAVGMEKDGMTYIKYRRRLDAGMLILNRTRSLHKNHKVLIL